MTGSQRRWHLRIWTILAFVIAAVLVAALAARPSPPREGGRIGARP